MKTRARLCIVLLCCTAVMSLACQSAAATTYTVSTEDDAGGVCSATPSTCTLRQAITSSNIEAGPDTVVLPAGNYALTTVATLTVSGSSTLTIEGAGAASTRINGVGLVTPITQGGGAGLTIRNVTITNGRGAQGGGILDQLGPLRLEGSVVTGNEAVGNGIAAGVGGGIYTSDLSNAALTLVDSVVSNNRADTSSGVAGFGGGVLAADDLTIVRSTISGNVIEASSSGGSGAGIYSIGGSTTITDTMISDNTGLPGASVGSVGGGYVAAGATTQMINTTVTGNSALGATAGGSTGGFGGGVMVGLGSITLINSTISGNLAGAGLSAGGSGGGVLGGGGPVQFVNTTVASNRSAGALIAAGTGGNYQGGGGTTNWTNSIVAYPSPGGVNCTGGTTTTSGRNIETGNSCGFGAGDLSNTDPLLGLLQSNGGATQTRAITAASPAFNAATGCPPPATDQRGVGRPQGSACDIGAFELEVAPPAPDQTAPSASTLVLKPSSFAPAGSGGSVIAKKKKRVVRGARVSFNLSEAASVLFTVEKQAKGRKKGKKCVAGRKRGKRCTIYKAVKGNFTTQGKAGSNSFKFSGRINSKKLKRGSYRLVATPSDAAHNRGVDVRKAFRIVG